ncbi:YegP family protein [Gordonia sp. (in: high G+C Gram-positive bacteria)]|uniref:YegP family protein n=1 Tax=Gordonia sp. (in: high G+C Gram-positive bacteria) TaxID=84139 RepID=UPI0039E3BF90
MAAKFELFEAKDGKFHFHLKAANGEITAQSQAYKTKEYALNGIEAIKRDAADAPVVEI